MSGITKRTLVFWIGLILFSIFVVPLLFSDFVFRDVEDAPEGYWFLPLCLLACIYLLRLVRAMKFLGMLFTNTSKFSHLAENDEADDEEARASRIMYLLFPISFVFGFLYGGIVAMCTSGLVFLSGGIRMALVAVFFISVVYLLVRNNLITLYLYDKFNRWIAEEGKDENDPYKKKY